MTHSIRRLATAVLLAACLGLAVNAQSDTDPRALDAFSFNLGPIGGLAKSVPSPGKTAKSGLQVQQLTEGAPAEAAGLEVDDVIIGAPKYFGEDAYLELGSAIAELESKAAGKPAELDLKVLRSGEEVEVTVIVVAYGNAAKKFPDGAMGDALIAQSLAWLAARQGGDGSWSDFRNSVGTVVLTSLCGMAFLAAGHSPATGDYKENVDRATAFVMEAISTTVPAAPAGSTANWDQSNWSLGFGGMFLSEVHRVAPRTGLEDKLAWVRDQIEANMEPSGGFGHGPGGPCSNNYVELEVVSNYCLAALGGIRAAGIKTDDKKLATMKAFVEQCIVKDGGMGYALPPKEGVWESCVGRTAGAMMAWGSLGLEKEAICKRFGEFITKNLGEVLDAHVSPTMHYLSVGCAAYKLGKKPWAEYWATYRSHFTMARNPDGSFTGRPTAESPKLGICPDQTYGPAWCAAHWTIVMCLPRENLPVYFGSKGKPKNPAKDS